MGPYKSTSQSRSPPDAQSRAHLIATSASESGAWLMPCLSLLWDCIRIAIGLRLGALLYQPHHCEYCGEAVDLLATHGVSCKRSQGRHYRHAATNDIIHQSLVSIKVPSHHKPSGLMRCDGKTRWHVNLLVWSCHLHRHFCTF